MKAVEAAYYNENDEYCYYWLLNLSKKRLIMEGDVDGRSIEDVTPLEVRAYRQCHFFAGIGICSLALRQAKYKPINDKERVWTGSCPCQTFSTAGKRKGFADERHLWPSWFWLIEHCRPELLFGEQVAHGPAVDWYALVSSDLASKRYEVGNVVLDAGGFAAPHSRIRRYFVAYASKQGKFRDVWDGGVLSKSSTYARSDDTKNKWSSSSVQTRNGGKGHDRLDDVTQRPYIPFNGFWAGADYLPGADHSFWSVERGSFPLVDGDSIRVDAVRAYGNAIVAPVAKEFIKAALACRP